MFPERQLVKTLKKICKQLTKKSLSAIKRQLVWLLRTLFLSKRRRGAGNAGFVLPTVAMVSLVVVLLTAAILFRSFERSKNASNVRVNEVVMNAASPAIDRARAKIDALLEDPTLPRGTPSDKALYDALSRDKYRLGDETRLKLAYDINDDDEIQATGTLENNETLKSAWKFAVDTDNNGKKDTFTLYGIYFRTPTRNSSGVFNRERNPLEARTPPMDIDTTNNQCSSASGFSTLVGNSSWYKLQSGNLGKSFFVYTVNVPITNLGSLSATDFEVYKGNKSVVALELQQDRNRIPLANNAVWFENDLEIIVGSTSLLLNGRVHTNGNLLVAVVNNDGNITLRQVSSKTSCFYNLENGQITVGGNVGNGSLSQVNNNTSVTVDLYRGFGENITTKLIDKDNRSTNQVGGANIGFNDTAYNQRIAAMKTTAIGQCTTCYASTVTTGSALKTAVNASGYPSEVKDNVRDKVQDSDDGDRAKNILSEEIEIYLRNRTRRVPFAEVAFGSDGAAGYGSTITAITASLDPPADWRQPLNSSNQFIGATSVTVTPTQLAATDPATRNGLQSELGDRIFVGNNLPARWQNSSGQYVDSTVPQFISNSGTAVNWTGGTTQRWRNTQIQSILDLGVSDRNGFWEEKAAENPSNDLDNVGGVRIVTGAGIYVDGPGSTVDTTNGPFYPRDNNSFLPAPSAASTLVSGAVGTNDIFVWPDTMPMSSPNSTETRKGDLLMRATAVYHYKVDYGTDQEPIACVSSYYDPSTNVTSKNRSTLPWNAATGGRSNNGIVYPYPSGGRSTFFATHKTRLQRQANLRFPNGRFVNKPLKDALTKIGTGTTVPNTGLQLADYSAIDTALCGVSILNNESSFVTTPSNQPKHGAIKEATFLDGREVKQNSASTTSSTYDLDLEQRQPLEIRVTDIDLSTTNSVGITNTAITTDEYLLPYSGIIYATRDDALADESDRDATTRIPRANSQLLSPTDFVLDYTRRPNGIRLINGTTLARTSDNAYNAKEKGLILASNLPAYIEGNFNLHRTSTTTGIEEFTEIESATVNFYNRSTANDSFACRKDRPGCEDLPAGDTTGDFWRAASIIADSMTLLSSDFEDGFRNQGDYDLNYNGGLLVEGNLNPASITASDLDTRRRDRLKNGFWDNNYATSTNWANGGTDARTDIRLGSYTLNGVTPVQRRVNNHPLYLMEICRKDLISQCGTNDWVVGFDINGDGALSTSAQNYTIGGNTVSLVEREIKAYQLGQALSAVTGYNAASRTNWNLAPNGATANPSTNPSVRRRLGAGDTGLLALQSADQRYPRRVAFARDNNNQLISASGAYKPMGVGCDLDMTGSNYNGNGCTYGGTVAGTNYGQTGSSALWFRTTNSTTNPADLAEVRYVNDRPLFYYPPIDADGNGSPDLDGQPLLVPVLQIHDANNTPSNTTAAITSASNIRRETDTQAQFKTRWLQQATETTFNAAFVLGNSPSRGTELSSGLQNFVRFLENWSNTSGSIAAKISGSFIQIKRSSFSTGPFASILDARASSTANSSITDNLSLFDYILDTYPTDNSSGRLPFYVAPDRKWGFDVALLSEQPDLFAQRFTAPPTGRPNEFFREVGRDDPWVKTLLCAGEASNRTGVPATSGSITYANAVPNEYRPSDCESIPND